MAQTQRKESSWDTDNRTGKVIKLTADKGKTDFNNERWEVEDIEDSYRKICSPFYSYIYEEIEKLRGNADEKEKY